MGHNRSDHHNLLFLGNSESSLGALSESGAFPRQFFARAGASDRLTNWLHNRGKRRRGLSTVHRSFHDWNPTSSVNKTVLCSWPVCLIHLGMDDRPTTHFLAALITPPDTNNKPVRVPFPVHASTSVPTLPRHSRVSCEEAQCVTHACACGDPAVSRGSVRQPILLAAVTADSINKDCRLSQQLGMFLADLHCTP